MRNLDLEPLLARAPRWKPYLIRLERVTRFERAIGQKAGHDRLSPVKWTLQDGLGRNRIFPFSFPVMASLWTRPDSKYLIACFTARDGRQLKRSTKTTDRRKAMKLAEQFEQEANAKRTAIQARRVISSLYKDLSGEELASQTLREFVTSFLSRKKPEVTQSTYAYYNGNLTRFLTSLGDRADKDIAEITRHDLTVYRNSLAETLNGKTVNHTMQCIKGLFREAKKDGFIVDDPGEFVEAVKARSVEVRRPFTLDEVKAVMAIANDEWRSMIKFGFYTGQRLSDIARLTWNNIDLKRGEIRIVTQKTGRRQLLPIAAPLLTHIESLTVSDDRNQPLHPTALGHVERTGKTGRLSNQFADLLISAGLRTAVKHDQEKGRDAARAKHELSFHALRHTATTLMKDGGIPASVVQDFIGHDDEAMSAHYTHTGTEALKKAAEALPDI